MVAVTEFERVVVSLLDLLHLLWRGSRPAISAARKFALSSAGSKTKPQWLARAEVHPT